MPLIVSVVGYAQSGKTLLLEKMIPLLKEKGYSVGVIKHTERFPDPEPGKDTTRLDQAGADGVVLVGDGRLVYWKKTQGEEAHDPDRLEQAFFMDRDVVFTEGFKRGNKPKIAVLTEGKEKELLAEIQGGIIATVGKRPCLPDIPHFQPEQLASLVGMLEERYLKDRKRPAIRIVLDGKNLPMNHFVQEILISGISGMLSPLKGYTKAEQVIVRICRTLKGSKQ